MSTPFKLKPYEPAERVILASVLRYLAVDRRVAWAERFNVGAAKVETFDNQGHRQERFVRFAFPGCSDILGQLVDGRLLAIEVKTRTGRVRPAQTAFLATVNANAGVAGIACGIADVIVLLDAACRRDQP